MLFQTQDTINHTGSTGICIYNTLVQFKNQSYSIDSLIFYKYFNLYFQIHVCRVALILHDSKVLYSCLSSFKCFKEKNNVYYLNLLQIFWVLLAKFSLPACSISSVCFIKIKLDWKADFLLCRLRSIATHKDHFVRRPSVCPSVCHTPM